MAAPKPHAVSSVLVEETASAWWYDTTMSDGRVVRVSVPKSESTLRSESAAALGRRGGLAGKGAAKRRDVDYAAMARKAVAVREARRKKSGK